MGPKYGYFTCPDCGTTVAKTSPNKKRCSACALKAHGETKGAPKKCQSCGKMFKPRSGFQKYCLDCRKEVYAQRKRDEATKHRRRVGMLPVGTTLQCHNCGEDFVYTSGPQRLCPDCKAKKKIESTISWMKTHIKQAQKIRKSAKDRYLFSGNRQKVLERDNYTCQHCGSKEDLAVHHIDGNGVTTPRNQRNNNVDNLITLCRACHTKVHMSKTSHLVKP